VNSGRNKRRAGGSSAGSDDGFFEPFVPDAFCREFVELRGHSNSIFNYMAVVLELKPLLDDWIPRAVLDSFVETGRKKYGLHVMHDVALAREWGDDRTGAPLKGGAGPAKRKTQRGRQPVAVRRDYAHVFVSRSPDNLEKGYRSGWYPGFQGSEIERPFADNLRFGGALGYPACCLDFFAASHAERNFLFSILSATGGEPDFRCNCLAKDTPYSYIHHMPCSFNCRESILYADNLRAEILKREPDYVRRTDRHLRLPYLVFEDQFIYAFDGRMEGTDAVSYSRSRFVGHPRCDAYSELFAGGDRLEVSGKKFRVFRGGEPAGGAAAPAKNRMFLVRFA